MRWIVLDVAVALLALAALGLVGLSLWRRVRALGRQLAAAGQTLDTVMADMPTAGDRTVQPGVTRRPVRGGAGGAPRRTLAAVDLGEAP